MRKRESGKQDKKIRLCVIVRDNDLRGDACEGSGVRKSQKNVIKITMQIYSRKIVTTSSRPNTFVLLGTFVSKPTLQDTQSQKYNKKNHLDTELYGYLIESMAT